ncbi:MAG: homospermidine synthase [Actinobacteria bacterium]|nr:homospermidine synthase [Actinomycetota bacterium]NCV43915.1 homospermidine synthase [Actinomycetota bacterium]NCV83775.1 homospermidine synthase [Actinomycetota bacterium]NCV95717.1 homospermidine synthase [Actinomycetota bacterium]NCW47422.1 homospermidine synthase [Actinomycetota bacterium]
MSARFTNKVLILGAGSVSQSVLPLLIEHLVDAKQITIMDQRDNRSRVQSALNQGATYVQDQITRGNLDAQLSKYLKAGDFLLDLAWNIDANTILQWCHDHGVLYLNTSIEEWDPYEGGSNKHPLERTLYYRHMRMRDMKSRWTKTGATAIVEHGANPGLVSHLVKKSLVDIATRALKDGKAGSEVEGALVNENYQSLAHALNVKVIHISERDTQVTNKPKQWGEFVNTWSVEGFYEEGVAPAELGWGTHEKTLPVNAYEHPSGPKNQIAIAQPGATTWVRSWVPNFEIQGMVIRHGEAFTISDHLTVWENGKAIYRPTVHYAYCPSNEAIVSMKELEMLNWELHKNQRIMNDEITAGDDRLGVLLMGHPYKSWWTGSLLNIEDSRKLIPGQSATTVQVSSAVYAAVAWAMKNPNAGLLVPDELPWREVLGYAEKYWGGIHSEAADWDPLVNRRDLFEGWNDKKVDRADPWQFSNFLV